MKKKEKGSRSENEMYYDKIRRAKFTSGNNEIVEGYKYYYHFYRNEERTEENEINILVDKPFSVYYC